jgi:group I intron endonuclease
MELYGIRNLLTDKIVYVGISSKSAEKRFARHVADSRLAKPPQKIHRTIKKYGAENFVVEVLATVDDWNVLIGLEVEAIAEYKTFVSEGGCSLTRGGEGVLGHKPSPEQIERHTLLLRGRKHSVESRLRMSEGQKSRTDPRGMKGKQQSDDAKALLRAHNAGSHHPQFGKSRSEETKSKLREANRGRIVPQSERDKVSAALKGKPKSAEHNRKVSEAKKGKPLSDEHKEALKAGARRRWQSNIIVDGVIYPTITEAAETLGHSRDWVKRHRED